MKQRVIFWGSVILAVGGIVCAAVCMSAEGGANIALWIAALVLIALGVIGLSLTRYGDSKQRSAKYEREREEERAAYEGAKYLSILYGGRKKRMGAPTQEDTFLIELYLTQDEAALQRYFEGKMPKDRADAFYREHARLLATVFPTLQELEQLSDRVIFINRTDYAVMRGSEAYRTLFSKNKIVSI